VSIAEPDPCLALYPLASWDAFCERIDAAVVKDDRFRRIVRHIMAHSDQTSLDAQGRLLIPPVLRAYAGIEREVVTIGSLTRVEVWSKERLGETAPTPDETAAFVAELGLY
jgi:MraZ protein